MELRRVGIVAFQKRLPALVHHKLGNARIAQPAVFQKVQPRLLLGGKRVVLKPEARGNPAPLPCPADAFQRAPARAVVPDFHLCAVVVVQSTGARVHRFHVLVAQRRADIRLRRHARGSVFAVHRRGVGDVRAGKRLREHNFALGRNAIAVHLRGRETRLQLDVIALARLGQIVAPEAAAAAMPPAEHLAVAKRLRRLLKEHEAVLIAHGLPRILHVLRRLEEKFVRAREAHGIGSIEIAVHAAVLLGVIRQLRDAEAVAHVFVVAVLGLFDAHVLIDHLVGVAEHARFLGFDARRVRPPVHRLFHLVVVDHAHMRDQRLRAVRQVEIDRPEQPLLPLVFIHAQERLLVFRPNLRKEDVGAGGKRVPQLANVPFHAAARPRVANRQIRRLEHGIREQNRAAGRLLRQ